MMHYFFKCCGCYWLNLRIFTSVRIRKMALNIFCCSWYLLFAHKQGLIKFFPKYETKDTRQKKVEILVSIFTHTKNQVLEVFKPRLPLPTNYCFKGNGKGRERFYRDQSFSVCLFFIFFLFKCFSLFLNPSSYTCIVDLLEQVDPWPMSGLINAALSFTL